MKVSNIPPIPITIPRSTPMPTPRSIAISSPIHIVLSRRSKRVILSPRKGYRPSIVAGVARSYQTKPQKDPRSDQKRFMREESALNEWARKVI